VQIASRAVFPNAAHDFMGFVGGSGNFSPIEINRQRRVTSVGQLRGLLLDPIIQSPIFVDDQQRRKRAFTLGSVQDPLHGFIAALVGNSLAAGGESGDGQCKKKYQARKFHGEFLVTLRTDPRAVARAIALSFHNASSMYNAPSIGLGR